jgi:hypothetical protein
MGTAGSFHSRAGLMHGSCEPFIFISRKGSLGFDWVSLASDSRMDSRGERVVIGRELTHRWVYLVSSKPPP